MFRRILKERFQRCVLIVRDLLKTKTVICASARWRAGDRHEKRPDRRYRNGDIYGPSNCFTRRP
ncbi:hypothetical protein [Paraburkholderia graminis]|uniref:hypothetical protein n=1 Tax=Paraburkholderia graminis TaxID=60548 RepID=UPI0038B9ED89